MAYSAGHHADVMGETSVNAQCLAIGLRNFFIFPGRGPANLDRLNANPAACDVRRKC